jgi:hypothetical protein
MTLKAKILVKDKFWIIEENGQKLGTLQKKDDNGWIFLGKKDQRQEYLTQESLYARFGSGIFASDITVPENEIKTEESEWHVHGYPCSQQPYNAMFDVQKQLPIYTKTPKSRSLFCAGYYIIDFPKGWRKAYCPKVITLQRYAYKGPIKSKIEMQQILNNAIKEQNTDTTH